MGTINPIGSSVKEFWENLVKGKSGVRHLQSFPIDGYSVQIAGEIDLPDLSTYFKNKKMAKRLDRYVILAQIAATQAIRDSGLDVDKAPQRYGVIIGTGEGGVGTRYNNTVKMLRDGMQSSSPFFVMCIPSTASGYFAMEWNLQGPCFSVNSACATGNHAFGVAASLIKMGMADAIFTGGAEAPIFPSGMAAFGNIMALSERNNSPERPRAPSTKTGTASCSAREPGSCAWKNWSTPARAARESMPSSPGTVSPATLMTSWRRTRSPVVASRPYRARWRAPGSTSTRST